MKEPQPRILVFYSNPGDSARLRLDKEHRAVGKVLQRHKLPDWIIDRMHATCIEDISDCLRERRVEIVQFSGHGDPSGFYLESNHPAGDAGELVAASRVAALLSEIAPQLRAAIFVSCYSSDSIRDLTRAAPYLITITGPADDSAAIEFIRAFYDQYLSTSSVSRAFHYACLHLEMVRGGERLAPVLFRRAERVDAEQFVVEAFPGKNADSILIDLSEAVQDIDRLDIPRDEFLSLFTRKIRVHRAFFQYPRERAVLSIGRFFCVFSWENVDDRVVCHRVMQIRDDISDEVLDLWTELGLRYHDLYCQRYRSLQEPWHPSTGGALERAIEAHHRVLDYLDNSARLGVLLEACPDQARVTRSVVRSNLVLSDLKFHDGDYPATVSHLEAALSSIHDLLDELTRKLTVHQR